MTKTADDMKPTGRRYESVEALNGDGWPCILPGQAGAIAHATWQQRAEALCKVKGVV